MGKRRETILRRDWYRAPFCGCIAAVILSICLIVCAAAGERFGVLLVRRSLTARLCLMIAALFCGLASAGKAKQDRLPLALAGEGVMFAFVLMFGCVRGFQSGWISLLIDAGIMLFGAFAGAFSYRRPGIQRRGKR